LDAIKALFCGAKAAHPVTASAQTAADEIFMVQNKQSEKE
jgi:hypothetical protein